MSKKPTIKRILKEASELASQPSLDYHAAPLETDLFEWHFTIRGPPAPSPFEGGIYHGRIVLPPAYPLKPPSFRFLTPSGRFEVNREICLSISGFHEETWQPAWGIRTALVAIRSFMDTNAKGQVGGMDSSEELRRRLAGQSKGFRCAGCGKSNEEILKEQAAAVKEAGTEAAAAGAAEAVVPDELRLAYREDLGKQTKPAAEGSAGNGAEENRSGSDLGTSEASRATTTETLSKTTPSVAAAANSSTQPPSAAPAATPAGNPQQIRHPNVEQGVPGWIDKAIYGILAMLAFLIWKKFLL